MRATLALAFIAGLAGCAMRSDSETAPTARQARASPPAAGALMTWDDLEARPRPVPDRTIRYGPAAEQVVDLWLPAGAGPHPVVVMVHGGCWRSDIADRTIMNWIAGDLRGRGVAVWNIDYRGVDRPGGGYPGTFQDAASAADALRATAPRHNLDLRRVVAIGHSAGGHLALWLAARQAERASETNPLIPRGSPLLSANPLPIAVVVSLGGLPDLELAATPPGSGCGTEAIEKLVGPPTMSSRNVYADTSLPRLAPLGVPQVLINGRQDRIIPAVFADAYAARMRAAGDDVRVRWVEATGHVELIAPGTAAWATAVEEIMVALRR